MFSPPSGRACAGLRDALASTGFALIAAAVLGTVITAGEFRHKTATGTYLDQPGRTRVLAAKALAAAAAASPSCSPPRPPTVRRDIT